MSDRWAEFRRLRFMPSRIPAQDALVAFIPDGQAVRASVQKTVERIGASRWFPAPGGHELLIPYEGGDFDRNVLTVRAKGWDHETCSSCKSRVPAMTPCWVTEDGPFRLLCTACKTLMDAETGQPA